MRNALVFVLLFVIAPLLHAKEESPFVSPFRRHIEKAKEAAVAGDAETLRQLATNRMPDAWDLAEELLRLGDADAAAELAAAVEGPYFEALPAYVEARRQVANPTQPHRLFFDVTRTLNTKGPKAAIEMLGPMPSEAPDTVIGVRLLAIRGVSHQKASAWDDAAAAYDLGADAAKQIGWMITALELRGASAASLWRGGRWERSIKKWNEQRAIATSIGDELVAARALGYSAMVMTDAGRSKDAVEVFVVALKTLERLKNQPVLSEALSNYGLALQRAGRILEARTAYERSLRLKEGTHDEYGIAIALGNLASLYSQLGEFAKALALYERSLARAETSGDKHTVAATCIGMGNAHTALGQYAKALAALDRGLEIARAMNARPLVTTALSQMARIHALINDRDRALSIHEEVLKLYTERGEPEHARVTRKEMAIIHAQEERFEEARTIFESVLAEQRAAGQATDAAVTLGNLAGVYAKTGDHEKALALRRQALEEIEAQGARVYLPWLLVVVGSSLLELGRTDEAEPMLKRAVAAARSTRLKQWQLSTLAALAKLYLETDRPGRALSTAQRALDAVETLVGGLGEEQGAKARAGLAGIFDIGALAAAREEDPAEVLNFLESGRAGALLDALDRREALRWKADSLPPDLRKLDVEAREAERSARATYDAAAASGNLKQMRAAGKALDAATERVRGVSARIQRDLKQQANFFYPRPKTLDEIRSVLKDDQALVLYGVAEETTLAVVIGPERERIVDLGASEPIEEACEALTLDGADADVTPALAELRKRLIEPLNLSKSVKYVLISPDGSLCYLPFSAFMERTVSMCPSGTTHVLLLGEESPRGTGVLAIGAPDYAGISEGARKIHHRGRPLSPLPAARVEIEKVGTKQLLGAAASEAALAEALGSVERWRAVHFACHGLVDMERPMMSSLALASSKVGDGFLTALEVMRMPIPTDLAVLSACETGRGEIVRGEGILGLTRAFMFAGAPRVLCSLWKVDDAATQALMIKFYELWNPKEGKGLGAAAALKQAQEHVRAQEKWRHPYYWAAWQLWGLPK